MTAAEVVRLDATELARPLPPSARPRLIVARHRGTIVGHAWDEAGGPDPLRALAPAIAAVELEHVILERAGTADPPGPPVAVVVATRDRPRALARCLESLARLEPPAGELIVVDAGDGSAEVAALAATHGARHLAVPRAGASRARNAGVALAAAPLVAFLDDDCVVEPDWLARAPAAFERDPLLAAVVGYVGPLALDTRAQVLFEGHDGFQWSFSRWELTGPQAPPLPTLRLGVGNAVVRRSAFEAAGGMSERLGPGTPTRSQEDADLHMRLLRDGGRVVWDPSLVAWHEHRSTLRELRRTLAGYATGSSAFATQCLLEGDLRAAMIWAGYAGHIVTDVRRRRLRAPRAAPARVIAAEVAGLLAGPVALLASRGARRVPQRPSLPGPRPAARVLAEPPDGVTVAVASRNRPRELGLLLEALDRQTFPPERLEVVVVLDGDREGSASALRQRGTPYRLRVIEHADRLGVAAARNRGAQAAAEPLVLFLDDDLQPVPELVALHAARHARPGERAVLGVCPPLPHADTHLDVLVRSWWADHLRRKSEPAHVWSFVDFTDANASLPRALLDRVGGFDDRLERAQDYELGWRLLAAGARMELERAALADHAIDTSFSAVRERARLEGAAHVALVRRHPQALQRLPLAREVRQSVPRRWSAAVPVARRLDARRTPGGAGVVQLAVRLAYRRGIRDAATTEELTALGARAPAVLDLELAADTAVAVPDGTAAARVRFLLGGTPVAEVDATDASGQWCWRDLAGRAAGQLDPAAVDALLQRALTRAG